MPKIDLAALPVRVGTGYPEPFNDACAGRTRRRLGDAGEVVLRPGDCAAFPKGSGDGHHLKNTGSTDAVYLEVGSRHPDDLTTCADVDMMSYNKDGAFRHKDGTPYP